MIYFASNGGLKRNSLRITVLDYVFDLTLFFADVVVIVNVIVVADVVVVAYAVVVNDVVVVVVETPSFTQSCFCC